MTLHMPAETAAQDRVWMAFPSSGYTLGDTEAEAEAARDTWAAVARATSEFTPDRKSTRLNSSHSTSSRMPSSA